MWLFHRVTETEIQVETGSLMKDDHCEEND